MSDTKRYAIWPDPRSRSQRSESCKMYAKWPISKSYLLRQYACDEKRL